MFDNKYLLSQSYSTNWSKTNESELINAYSPGEKNRDRDLFVSTLDFCYLISNFFVL